MFKKYFTIIMCAIMVFFLAGRAYALRVPVDQQKIGERWQDKHLYNAVQQLIQTREKELRYMMEELERQEKTMRYDAHPLRNSVTRMVEAVIDISRASHMSENRNNAKRLENVIKAVVDFVRSDTILGTVEWIEKAFKKQEKDEIEKLYKNLKQTVEEEYSHLLQLKSVLSKDVIGRMANGEYFRGILAEIFIGELNRFYPSIIESKGELKEGIKKIRKPIQTIPFTEDVLVEGSIVFSASGDPVLLLGESEVNQTKLAIEMVQKFGFAFGTDKGIRILSCMQMPFAGPYLKPSENTSNPILRIGRIKTVILIEQSSDIKELSVKVFSPPSLPYNILRLFETLRAEVLGKFNIECVTLRLPENPTSELFSKGAAEICREVFGRHTDTNPVSGPNTSTNL